VLGLALIGGCARSETATPTQGGQNQVFRNVTPAQASALTKEEANLVVLDVRTPEEFAQERIENAINLDYYSDTFRDDLDKLDKEAKYLLYCRTSNRSGNAFSIMKSLEFQEVHHLLGGIVRWKQEGLPTVR
jgi:rhodanese-related sulfurtransferase